MLNNKVVRVSDLPAARFAEQIEQRASKHQRKNRSARRTEDKMVENSALFKQAIAEIMRLRAMIMQMNESARALQSTNAILDKENKDFRAYYDSQESQAAQQPVEVRSEEPADTQRTE